MSRAYLLGMLPDDAAAAVEETYFVNRSAMEQMYAAERRLIEAYLDGLLKPDELRRFEERYLQTPVLKRLVDREKRKRGAAAGWAVKLAWIAAVLCVVGACIWIYAVRHRATPIQARVRAVSASAPLLTAATLRLNPGVNKRAGAEARMDLPPEHTPVKLIAQLPGLREPVACTARLYIVGVDGSWKKILSAGPLRTTSAGGNVQELTVAIPPATLHPGDYVMEAALPNGHVRETYVFHVSPQQ